MFLHVVFASLIITSSKSVQLSIVFYLAGSGVKLSIRDKDKEALHASCVSLELSLGQNIVGCFIILGF